MPWSHFQCKRGMTAEESKGIQKF
uniref:Uncharacterized protein n=1 Tax=Rhizophora mucronata TaxID=61149 RepID=A0A2P2R5D4_RHIMU